MSSRVFASINNNNKGRGDHVQEPVVKPRPQPPEVKPMTAEASVPVGSDHETRTMRFGDSDVTVTYQPYNGRYWTGPGSSARRRWSGRGGRGGRGDSAGPSKRSPEEKRGNGLLVSDSLPRPQQTQVSLSGKIDGGRAEESAVGPRPVPEEGAKGGRGGHEVVLKPVVETKIPSPVDMSQSVNNPSNGSVKFAQKEATITRKLEAEGLGVKCGNRFDLLTGASSDDKLMAAPKKSGKKKKKKKGDKTPIATDSVPELTTSPTEQVFVAPQIETNLSNSKQDGTQVKPMSTPSSRVTFLPTISDKPEVTVYGEEGSDEEEEEEDVNEKLADDVTDHQEEEEPQIENHVHSMGNGLSMKAPEPDPSYTKKSKNPTVRFKPQVVEIPFKRGVDMKDMDIEDRGLENSSDFQGLKTVFKCILMLTLFMFLSLLAVHGILYAFCPCRDHLFDVQPMAEILKRSIAFKRIT